MLLVGCAAIGVLLEIFDPLIFFNFGALSAGATCSARKTLPGSERWCISAVSALSHGCILMRAPLFSNRLSGAREASETVFFSLLRMSCISGERPSDSAQPSGYRLTTSSSMLALLGSAAVGA